MTRDGGPLASITLTRNATGQVTASDWQGLPGASQTYAYEDSGRLSDVSGAEYAYDPAGNPTKLGSTDGLTYNAADELIQAHTPDGLVDYGYDAVGNRTATTPASGPSTSYQHDQTGRLTSIERTGDAPITYSYDGAGLRASKTKNGTTTRFTWDADDEIPLLLSEGDTSYIYDAHGLPLERIDEDGQVVFFHHDQLGSTRTLTDADGAVVATYNYDAYGTLATSTGSVTTPFGYAGEYTDHDTGLIYLRARYYDPTTAQFLTRDPLEDISAEPYLYAGGDPVNSIDPLGLIENPLDWEITQDVSDSAAGFGDGATDLISDVVNRITFGGVDLPTTYDIRAAMGANGAVDFCSGWYGAGETAGETTVVSLISAPGVQAAWRAGRGGKDLIVSRARVPTGGRKWRISPTGHRPNPNATKPAHWGRNLPHYHRRPGISKHRPWEGGF